MSLRRAAAPLAVAAAVLAAPASAQTGRAADAQAVAQAPDLRQRGDPQGAVPAERLQAPRGLRAQALRSPDRGRPRARRRHGRDAPSARRRSAGSASASHADGRDQVGQRCRGGSPPRASRSTSCRAPRATRRAAACRLQDLRLPAGRHGSTSTGVRPQRQAAPEPAPRCAQGRMRPARLALDAAVPVQRPPRASTWRLQFDKRRRYSRFAHAPRARLKIPIL